MVGYVLMLEPTSESQAPDQPPQGWYGDPENQAQRRWWDGKQWTGEYAMKGGRRRS